MFYCLNKNVYLVNGAQNGCLYDFNTNKLYSVNHALAQLLTSINNGEINRENINCEQLGIVDSFISQGLIVMSEAYKTSKINDLINSKMNIDFAWIEITTKCNLKCVHCYNESDAHCTSEMNIDDYKLVIDSLIKLGVKRIQIIGGEPFFNRESLRQMLDYTIGKFDFIEIFTNGTLITDEWLIYIKQNDIQVALSVYSYDCVIHDKVTKQVGSWQRTNRIISELDKNDIPYRVCNVLMDGVDIGQKNTMLYDLSNDKDIARMSGRASLSLLSDELLRKKLITKSTFSKALSKAFTRRLITGHNCFCNKIYISSELIIYPCVMERRIDHGHVDRVSGIILNNDIRAFTKDRINGCKDCEYRYTCFDCRPDSLSDDIYEKPWYCTYDPLTGNWADVDDFIDEIKASKFEIL